ncbi:hypothetical protein [Paraburkholderia ferrariae]|uniref:Uncharacterized protein n=1 Tax=Paraburkholderia ferrariae TaxID=386056 RepID=A0ABU9S2R2_9BURK
MKIELLSQYGQRAFASNGGQRQSFPKPLMNAQAFFCQRTGFPSALVKLNNQSIRSAA